jgi:pyruvate kinase
VAAKIERREAAHAIASIAGRVDAIWICRGDLGVQLGAPGLARFVASLRPSAFRVPVLMAGQVLEHLTRHRQPTRSEVCHLFDLADRGYRGFVLSDETAIGDDPLNAVETATSLLRAFHSLNTAG